MYELTHKGIGSKLQDSRIYLPTKTITILTSTDLSLMDQVLIRKSHILQTESPPMTTEKTTDSQPAETIEKYSVFTTAEKWCIIAMVSYAAWFSTLSSFIYYPAIHELSQVFSVSVNKINLTVTSYMAVATIAPTLVGDAADVLGRRPVYMITLSLYIGANMAIVLADRYSALVGLRILQALAISGTLLIPYLGSTLMLSGTFSIAYGEITDVASPAERGSFVSAVSFA